MSFTKAVVRQVGRDLGKVISNQVFKDAHSTPYRRVGQQSSSRQQTRQQTRQRQAVQQAPVQTQATVPQQSDSITSKEFDRALNFATTFTPQTMVRKMAGVYEVIKTEIYKAAQDGYLDTEEAKMVFEMESQFQRKAEIITDLLELDEEANKKPLEDLANLIQLTQRLFHRTLKLAIKGAEVQYEYYRAQAESVQPIDKARFIWLHAAWMGHYARTGQKRLANTITANLFSLLVFVFTFFPPNLIGLVNGFIQYSSEKNKRTHFKTKMLEEAELEKKRKALFEQVQEEAESEEGS